MTGREQQATAEWGTTLHLFRVLNTLFRPDLMVAIRSLTTLTVRGGRLLRLND